MYLIGGQFGADKPGQFAPDSGGQLRANWGGHIERIFQLFIDSHKISELIGRGNMFFPFAIESIPS